MSIFDTDSRLPFTYGFLTILGACVIAAAAVWGAFSAPLSGLTFVFALMALGGLCLSAWIGWQLFGYMRSSYTIDRNAFVIRWGLVREIVPMGDVQRVIPASEMGSGLKLRRFPLPGWWRGTGAHPAMGGVSFYATDAPAKQIVVITADNNFVVSPYDTEAFLDAFKARFEMKPTQPVIYSRVEPPLLAWPFWRDRVAQTLLALALALNLGAFGVGLFRFPSVSVQIPMHFDGRGIADRLASKTQLFTPAFIGLGLLGVSVLLGLALYARKDQLSAYVLWGGGVAVQAMFIVAIVTLGFS